MKGLQQIVLGDSTHNVRARQKYSYYIAYKLELKKNARQRKSKSIALLTKRQILIYWEELTLDGLLGCKIVHTIKYMMFIHTNDIFRCTLLLLDEPFLLCFPFHELFS